MKVQVLRRWFTEKSTISEIRVDGLSVAFGLEDRRVPGVDADAFEAGVMDSVKAFNRLFPPLERVVAAGAATIEYVNLNPPAALLA